MDNVEHKDERLASAVWEARREINLRIVVQNVLVMLQILMIVGLSLASGFEPQKLAVTWFVGMAGSFMFGQAWLHSGIRHAQYRAFFRENLDLGEDRTFIPWETFLKAMRPRGVLGSHWYISTKALFAVSHLSILISALVGSHSLIRSGGFQILVVVALVTSVAFVLILRHPDLPRFDPDSPGLKKR